MSVSCAGCGSGWQARGLRPAHSGGYDALWLDGEECGGDGAGRAEAERVPQLRPLCKQQFGALAQRRHLEHQIALMLKCRPVLAGFGTRLLAQGEARVALVIVTAVGVFGRLGCWGAGELVAVVVVVVEAASAPDIAVPVAPVVAASTAAAPEAVTAASAAPARGRDLALALDLKVHAHADAVEWLFAEIRLGAILQVGAASRLRNKAVIPGW